MNKEHIDETSSGEIYLWLREQSIAIIDLLQYINKYVLKSTIAILTVTETLAAATFLEKRREFV